MKTAAKVGAALFALILIYLLVSHGDAVNKLLTLSGNVFLKGTALLQGRPSADLANAGVY